MFDLREFGWDGCIVPTDLKDVCLYVPSWRTLKVLRPPVVSHGLELRFPYTFFQDKRGSYMPGIIKLKQIDDGGYASIFKGRRALFIKESTESESNLHLKRVSPFAEVCIKEILVSIDPDEETQSQIQREKYFEDEVNAIIYEAFIHALLYKTMEEAGFVSAVPLMHEVLVLPGTQQPKQPSEFHSIWITMEFIQGLTLEKYLTLHLKCGAFTKNEALLKDVLIQLAFYLHILQTRMRFNHRDLKVNNVFVRLSPAAHLELTLPNNERWRCTHNIVIIDFGFSCIACGEDSPTPRKSLLCAGSWFKPMDDCLKYGRDLAQFLYSLHCLYDLHDYISPALYDILYDAMNVEYNGRHINLMDGLDESGEPVTTGRAAFHDGIYIFLRKNAVDIPGCAPETFMAAITAQTRCT